jgi:hypothetical protein
MSKYVVLLDAKGVKPLGSDSVMPIDGRWNLASIRREVNEYRDTFKKYFPHKYNEWQKFGIVPNLRQDPHTIYDI